MPLLLAMPFGPLLGWKRGDIARRRATAAGRGDARRLAIAAAFALQHGGPVLAPFGIGLAIFIMPGALVDVAERTMILRLPFGTALRRARRPAALGLGHGAGAFRHRRHAARHCRQ